MFPTWATVFVLIMLIAGTFYLLIFWLPAWRYFRHETNILKNDVLLDESNVNVRIGLTGFRKSRVVITEEKIIEYRNQIPILLIKYRGGLIPLRYLFSVGLIYNTTKDKIKCCDNDTMIVKVNFPWHGNKSFRYTFNDAEALSDIIANLKQKDQPNPSTTKNKQGRPLRFLSSQCPKGVAVQRL